MSDTVKALKEAAQQTEKLEALLAKAGRPEEFEAGERELRKAFEEVTTRNVKAVIEYSRETRAMVAEALTRVQAMENNFQNTMAQLGEYRTQLAALQTSVFVNGSTPEDLPGAMPKTVGPTGPTD